MIQIIISLIVAIVIIIGLAIFIIKKGVSPTPVNSEANTAEKNTDGDQEIESAPTSNEAIDSNEINTSIDDTDFQVNDKDNIPPDPVTIDAKVILKKINSWQSGENSYIQVDVTVLNNSKNAIDDWEVIVPLPSPGAINDSWNMNHVLKNSSLTITGVDYNKSVPPNSSVDFGMILINPGDFDTAKASLVVLGDSINQDVSNDTTAPTSPDKGPDKAQDKGPDKPKATIAPSEKTDKSVPAQSTDDWLILKATKLLIKVEKKYG